MKNNNTIQAFWLSIGSMSSFTFAIVSSVILSRVLDKSDYGTFRQIVYIYNTLLIIFSAGLPQIFSYFLPRYSIENGKSVVSKITNILIITGAFFSLFLYLMAEPIGFLLNNEELVYGLKIFSPIPLLLFPTLGLEGIFSTYQKTFYVAVYNIVTRLLMLVFIVIPLFIYEKNYINSIYGWIIGSLFSLFIAYFLKKTPFKRVSSIKTDLQYKTIVLASLPLMFAGFYGVIIKSADQFFISRYFGAEVFAEFSNGFIQLPFVIVISGAASAVMAPIFSKLVYDRKGEGELIEKWQSVIIKSAKIIYPMVIFFYAFADIIMDILYTSNYSKSAIYFRISLLTNFFNIIIFSPLLIALGKTKVYSYVNGIAAIFIWFLGVIIITFFKSPFAISFLSVLITISISIFFIFYTSVQLKTKWVNIFPIKKLSVIVIHSSITLAILKFYFFPYLNQINKEFGLLIICLAFILLIVSTGKILRINYLEFLISVIKNRQNDYH
jgi:O-antigen/teichoic acid export membrane protein